MQALISRGYLREAPAAASRAPTIVCTGPRRSSGLPNADVKDDEADGTNGHIAVIHFATSNGSLWPLAGTHERQVRRSPVAIGIHGGRWVSMPRHPRRHGHQARRPMLLRPPDRHRQCAMRRLHAPRSSTFVCAEPGISPVHFSANACNLAQYFAPGRNAGECARSRMATSTIEQGALFCNMLRVLRG